ILSHHPRKTRRDLTPQQGGSFISRAGDASDTPFSCRRAFQHLADGEYESNVITPHEGLHMPNDRFIEFAKDPRRLPLNDRLQFFPKYKEANAQVLQPGLLRPSADPRRIHPVAKFRAAPFKVGLTGHEPQVNVVGNEPGALSNIFFWDGETDALLVAF